MGKFTELRQNLKDAVLSIHTEGNPVLAADLADAFGPYGVPLTSLTRDEAAAVASEFLLVRFSDQVAAFPDDAGLEDLAKALRK
jgi:hypothetical protein